MARGRMLNRKVATDDKVARYGHEFGVDGLVFHHRLIAFLDVNGNVRADPYWLKAEVMPRVSGISPEDCRKLSAGLVKHGLAVLYEAEGMPHLHFPKFRDNQVGLRTDRESAEYPTPQGFDEEAGTLPDSFRKPSGYAPAEVEVEVEGEVEGSVNGAREPETPAEARERYRGVAPRPTDLHKIGGDYVYPEWFERLWSEYPDRTPGSSKVECYRKCRTRLRNGADTSDLEDAAGRYRAFCESDGRIDTKYVKRAEVFYGPNEHWRDDWEVPDEDGDEGPAGDREQTGQDREHREFAV